MADLIPTNKTAKFAQNHRTARVKVTAACNSISAAKPTGVQQLFKAPVGGASLTKLSATPLASCTASSLVMFISKDDGITMELIDSELMAQQTVNATTKTAKTYFTDYSEDTPLRLEEGDSLWVGTMVILATGIVFFAQYSDYVATT